jgi:LSD1 subclass zinc finger protein
MSEVRCGSCGTTLNIPGPGQSVRCPRCGSLNAMGIPAEGGLAAVPPSGPLIGQFQPPGVPQPPLYGGYNPTGKATASLVLGILSILGTFCLLGIPLGIIGLIMGIMGRKSTRHGMAVSGIVMSIIGFVLSFVYAAVVLYLRSTGHPLFQDDGLSG